MPMYDYRCPECGAEFETIQPMAERSTAECGECGATANQRISPTKLDPFMDTPGARMKWRKDAERRGRGADMTRANREETSEETHRDAYNVRKALGETNITVS